MKFHHRAVLSLTLAATLVSCSAPGQSDTSGSEPGDSAVATATQSPEATPPTQSATERAAEIARCELRGPTEWMYYSAAVTGPEEEFRGALVLGARSETIDSGTEVGVLYADVADGIAPKAGFQIDNSITVDPHAPQQDPMPMTLFADGGVYCVTDTYAAETVPGVAAAQIADGSFTMLAMGFPPGSMGEASTTETLTAQINAIYEQNGATFKVAG